MSVGTVLNQKVLPFGCCFKTNWCISCEREDSFGIESSPKGVMGAMTLDGYVGVMGIMNVLRSDWVFRKSRYEIYMKG